jgi:membrane-associated phospholipid phosphatase
VKCHLLELDLTESREISNGNLSAVQPIAMSRRNALIIIAAALILWGIGFLLWMQVGIDKAVLFHHNVLQADDILISVTQTVTHYGMPLITFLYLIHLLRAFKLGHWQDDYRIYLLILLSFGIAGVGGDLLKEVFDRARPFVDYAGEIKGLSHLGSPSFPSGHATKSVALVLPFLFFIKAKSGWHKGLKILLAVVALGVCYSRVLLGKHYLSDVVAGIGMALLGLPFAVMLSNRILNRLTNEKLEARAKVWGLLLFGLMVYFIIE